MAWLGQLAALQNAALDQEFGSLVTAKTILLAPGGGIVFQMV
jgi:hypothetical protein